MVSVGAPRAAFHPGFAPPRAPAVPAGRRTGRDGPVQPTRKTTWRAPGRLGIPVPAEPGHPRTAPAARCTAGRGRQLRDRAGEPAARHPCSPSGPTASPAPDRRATRHAGAAEEGRCGLRAPGRPLRLYVRNLRSTVRHTIGPHPSGVARLPVRLLAMFRLSVRPGCRPSRPAVAGRSRRRWCACCRPTARYGGRLPLRTRGVPPPGRGCCPGFRRPPCRRGRSVRGAYGPVGLPGVRVRVRRRRSPWPMAAVRTRAGPLRPVRPVPPVRATELLYPFVRAEFWSLCRRLSGAAGGGCYGWGCGLMPAEVAAAVGGSGRCGGARVRNLHAQS